jgi:hypothetical protein
MAPPGHFILSLDVELAWGCFDHGVETIDRRNLWAEREAIRRVLGLLKRYQVPATFAIVGHLFLDSCTRENGTTHPEVLRPRYPWYGADWHDSDPATDLGRDPLWYGADIVDWILKANPEHEIGTHTFSHVVADDPACTPEIFRSQVEACRELHRRHGLELKSVIFPRNRIHHLGVVAELGLVAFRGPERSWYHRMQGWLKRACQLADRALAVPPPTYPLHDRVRGGLVDLPASMFLLSRDGVRRFVPLASRRRQALLGIQRAVERGELFHLWFHPFNLASDWRLLDVLDDVLRSVGEHSQRGQLVPITMGRLADELLSPR